MLYTEAMNINEFVAKKIGEVLAFTRVSTDTIEKAGVGLTETLGEEKIMDMLEKNRIHGEELLRIATDASVVDTTLEKADKTEEKLKEMRELYIAGKWDNPTEILEWSGFFEGAAIVHWALIRGAGEGLDNEELITLANEGISYHYELLEHAESELGSVGQDRSNI